MNEYMKEAEREGEAVSTQEAASIKTEVNPKEIQNECSIPR